MIEGIGLGVFAYISMLMSWHTLPERVRNWIVRWPFVADTLAGISTWLFITAVSKTLVAVIATFVATLLVNFSVIAYNAHQEHK